jgi:hypothetical protein
MTQKPGPFAYRILTHFFPQQGFCADIFPQQWLWCRMGSYWLGLSALGRSLQLRRHGSGHCGGATSNINMYTHLYQCTKQKINIGSLAGTPAT